MNDVIFEDGEVQDNSQREKLSSTVDGGNTSPSPISKQVLIKFQDYFNQLEYEVLIGLQNYYNIHDKWPTYKELSEFMDLDKNTVQPRLSELRDSHVVQTGEKRECDVSNHNTSVSTFKIADEWTGNNQ